MTDLFVPVWLALGLLMSIGAMMGMAISTKSGPMALSPLLAFGAFATATMFNDHRGAAAIMAISLLAFYVAWFAIIGIYMLASYVWHESETRDLTH